LDIHVAAIDLARADLVLSSGKIPQLHSRFRGKPINKIPYRDYLSLDPRGSAVEPFSTAPTKGYPIENKAVPYGHVRM
jgi:hypothetical protein